MGDRGNHRSSDPLRQDGGHRRPGPLRRARSSESQIQGVGARLRPGRFRQGRRRARQAVEPDRGGGAERRRSGKILSGDLLVFDAEDPGRQPVRQEGRRHPRQGQADRLAQPDEEQRLRRLPSDRAALDAHVPAGPGRIREPLRGLGEAHAGRAVRRADGQHPGRPALRRADQVFRRLDRTRRQG